MTWQPPVDAMIEPIALALEDQESSRRGAKTPVSSAGAHGPMQMMPATFRQYARPGERLDNADDNRRVARRLIADLYQRHGGDSAKVAAAYFSGQPNPDLMVRNPDGTVRPARDTNGKTVRSYVDEVLKRLSLIGTAEAAEPPAAAPLWEAPAEAYAQPPLQQNRQEVAQPAAPPTAPGGQPPPAPAGDVPPAGVPPADDLAAREQALLSRARTEPVQVATLPVPVARPADLAQQAAAVPPVVATQQVAPPLPPLRAEDLSVEDIMAAQPPASQMPPPLARAAPQTPPAASQAAPVAEDVSAEGISYGPAAPSAPLAVPPLSPEAARVQGSSALRDIPRATIDAATLGLADEARAAGMATGDYLAQKLGLPNAPEGSWGERYNLAKEEENRKNAEMSVGAQMAGLLLGGPSLAGRVLLKAPGLLRGAAQAAELGGAYGAASGTDPESRAMMAMYGTLLGGGTGLALPALAGTAKATAKVLRPAVQTEVGAEVRADQKLAEAIRRDKTTPQEMAARLDELGPDATIADVGGANVQGLGRATANLPGESKAVAEKTFEGRQLGAQERVMGEAEKALGTESKFYDSIDGLMQERKAAADPAYKEVHKMAVPFTEELQGILETPAGQAALRKAKTIAANERATDVRQWFGSISDDGTTMTVKEVPNMKVWDYIKRGMDDVVEAYRNPTTKKLELDTGGRAVAKVKSELIDELDTLTGGAYKKARDAWAGPTTAKEAVERGRSFMRRDSELSVKDLERLTPGEREFFRVGVLRGIRDQVLSVQDGANVVRRLYKTPAMREKMAAVFPDEASFEGFMKHLETENIYNKTRNAHLAGSRTAPLAAEMADTGGADVVGMAGDVIGAVGGSPGNLIKRAARAGYNYKRAGLNESTRNALGGRLFTTDQAANREVLARLLRRQEAKQASRGSRRAATSAATRFEQLQIAKALKDDNAE